MLVGMPAEVVAILLQTSDQFFERGVTIEISRKEKGGMYLVLSQGLTDRHTSISKLVAGKHEGNLLFGYIAPDDGPIRVDNQFQGIPAYLRTLPTGRRQPRKDIHQQGTGEEHIQVAFFCVRFV